MPRAIDMMKTREQGILKLLEHLSRHTEDFTNPKLVLIGGYALRTFTSHSRFTRDCDFIVEGAPPRLETVKGMIPVGWQVAEFKSHDTFGFMKWQKRITYGKRSANIAVDFMEGEIRGRTSQEIVKLDKETFERSKRTEIIIAGKKVSLFAPNYTDYLIMKVMSARESDIRDVASLVREGDVPKDFVTRVEVIIPYPELIQRKLGERIIPVIQGEFFMNSWRGILGTTDVTEEDRLKVLKSLESLASQLAEARSGR